MNPAVKLVTKSVVGTHKTIWRLTGGRIGSKLMGMRIMLLTTTGARSGKRRRVPLGYFYDSGDFVVCASNGGRRHNPDWYYNLTANPDAHVEINDADFEVIADEATGDDRERLWDILVSTNPGYRPYAERMKRRIPLIRLRPQQA